MRAGSAAVKVAAVILAAGASTRLGEPKQLVQFDSSTGARNLLERSIHIVLEAELSPVIVVLGANHAAVVAGSNLEGAVVVYNDDWRKGMASTLRRGIHALIERADDVEGVVLMTCDQPAVTSAHLLRLINAEHTTASSYAGRQGVPAYFLSKDFANLLALHGDEGARSLLRSAHAEPLQNGEIDIDTPDDLLRARHIFPE